MNDGQKKSLVISRGRMKPTGSAERLSNICSIGWSQEVFNDDV